MPTIQDSHKLYLYQLLKGQIGLGKQTLLSKVEQIFDAEKIRPQDLEFSSWQTLLEAMPEQVKITVFKKGYVYATLIEDEAFEVALSAPNQKDSAASNKPWKRKRNKTIKPLWPKSQIVEAEAVDDAGDDVAETVVVAAGNDVVETVDVAAGDDVAETVDVAETLNAAPGKTEDTPTPQDQVEATLAPEEQPARTLQEILDEAQATEQQVSSQQASSQQTLERIQNTQLPRERVVKPRHSRALPRTISRDVHVPETVYNTLDAALNAPNAAQQPVEVLLDNSWSEALSAHKVEGTRSNVVFSVGMYTLNLRRLIKPKANRSWELRLAEAPKTKSPAHQNQLVQFSDALQLLEGSDTPLTPSLWAQMVAQVEVNKQELLRAVRKVLNFENEQYLTNRTICTYVSCAFVHACSTGSLQMSENLEQATFCVPTLTNVWNEPLVVHLTAASSKEQAAWHLDGVWVAEAEGDTVSSPLPYLSYENLLIAPQPQLFMKASSLSARSVALWDACYGEANQDKSAGTVLETDALLAGAEPDAASTSGASAQSTGAAYSPSSLKLLSNMLATLQHHLAQDPRLALPVFDPYHNKAGFVAPLGAVAAVLFPLAQTGEYQLTALISRSEAKECAGLITTSLPIWTEQVR